MLQYTDDTLIAVYSFTRQIEGEEVVIGRPDTNVFLVLPLDAVELLDYLANGNTVSEAQSLYQQKYDEIPDIQELLEVLESKGFIQPLVNNIHTNLFIDKTPLPHSAKQTSSRFHFINFPQSLAQKLFSRPVLIGCGCLIGLALLAITIDPSLLPGWSAHFFSKNLTLMRLFLISMSYGTLFLHEMAHLIAAKAVGVSSRMGISNRLWILVAETDMTGIWSVPQNQRYLPFLAGPLLDAVSASVIILTLFANSRGWLSLSAAVWQLSRAMLLIYLLRLLWQCYFFVRTDFYYVIANFFRCKSLMKDTEVFLRNQVARVFYVINRVNQSHIKASERRVIRCFAILWLGGRIAAFSTLIFISIPLVWNYYLAIFTTLGTGYQANPYAFIDALLMFLIVFTPQGLGFLLWIRSFFTKRG